MSSIQPKSILKKRPSTSTAPATGGPAPKGSVTIKSKKTAAPIQAAPEPESETDSDDDGSDSLRESDSDDDGEEGDVEDDEDVIRAMGEGQIKLPKKPKNTTLKPTAAPSFSLALNHLLSLPPSTSSLQPRYKPPSAHTARLERRAKSLIKDTKAAHFERGHVRDIIAGWGPRPALPFALWESKDARRFEKAQRGDDADEVEETGAEREKRLRRLAQRGVVRLFNAIAAAQGVPEKVAKEEAKKTRREDGASEMGGSEAGGGEEGAPPNKILRRPNVLGGRGKGEALSNLSKASFLDLIRAGTSSAGPALITTR